MIKHTTLVALILAFIVIVVGAYTRLTDAGLGCPDWPGCYGQLLVPESTPLYPDTPLEIPKAKTEMLHRYLASILGCLILGIAFLSLKSNALDKPIKIISLSLVALILAQGLLGMWTVTLKLFPLVVMGHLLGGFSTLSLLWLLYLRLHKQHKPSKPYKTHRHFRQSRHTGHAKLKFLAFFALIALILQLALGGWTSANYAALACPDFPTCLGQYWPKQLDFSPAFNLLSGLGLKFPTLGMDNDARLTIHFMHRLWAILVCMLTVILCVKLWRNQHPRFAFLLFFILCLQVTLGITNVLGKLPLSIAVMHNGVGALFLLSLITVNVKLRE